MAAPKLDRAVTVPLNGDKPLPPIKREKTVGVIARDEDDEPDPLRTFKILGKLGEGAFGSVVKALDSRDGKLVAIKIVGTEDEDLSQLDHEIEFLKDCKSQYVVGFRGSFVVEKKLWIAMEYCDAGSLLDLMKATTRPLTEPQIAAAMAQTAQGLVALHKQRTVHRDLKAANILLTSRGECKLADFGVSCVLTSQYRHSLKGTPYWMAPEVVNAMAGAGYDWHADIWSLGITAYELATGKPPLSDVHPMRAIFKIANAPAPTLPEGKDWSPEFQQFIRACLNKEFRERPPASELLNLPFLSRAIATSASVLATLAEAALPAIDAKRVEADQSIGDEATLASGAAAAAAAAGAAAGAAHALASRPSVSERDESDGGSIAIAPEDDAGDGGTIIVKPDRKPSYMRYLEGQDI